MTVDEWRAHARRLADALTSEGVITDPVWARIVANVPRHLFVPGVPLDVAYSDEVLVTQRIEHGGYAWPTSSSTAPSLMLRMLQELELSEGVTAGGVGDALDVGPVLEIGLGTGYNAALLSERVGDKNVVSVDIDPVVVTRAFHALQGAGYMPVTGCRDGRDGYPERRPYGRLIATVAFESIPYAWVEQVRPGGLIVADLRTPGAPSTGGLVKLTVQDDGSASGRFLPLRYGFMSARTDYRRPGVAVLPALDKSAPRSRYTAVGGAELERDGLGLAVWEALGSFSVFPSESAVTVLAADGSWAEVPKGAPGVVTYGGPVDLWAEVESVRARWLGQGEPGVGRYRIMVSERGQSVVAG
ncbi:methyltransferase domain-containing protein [Actinocorallia lasiicapitis]